MKALTLIAFLACTAQAITAQDFTLEQVLSAPYCTDLVGSENGKSIAWVSNEKGVRKIFVAHAPFFQPRELYASAFDNGQVLSGLQFDHDGRLLYFVEGSAPNRSGEVANPASLVNYPGQKLFSLDIESSELDDLGSHSSFVIAPDDRYLLIPKGKTLSKLTVENEVVEPLITMRGNFSHVSFSPDGLSIVFTSNRGDHSFVGAYTFGETRIKWLAPSVDFDQFPQWSPDGEKVTFIRTPGNTKGELTDITSGTRFSVVVYDFSSGKESTIWSSPSDDGGFAQYYYSRPLRWAKNGKILFYSEHEGWMKIYSMNEDGSDLRNLLPGACEIEQSNLNQKGNSLVFSSNCDDIDRRDIFVRNLETGITSQLTKTSDLETDPVMLNGDTIVYRKGGYNYMTAIASGNGIIYPVDLSMEFPKQHLVNPVQAIFEASDGTPVHGQLFVKDRITKKPAVIFMHGGPIRQMLLGFHYSSYYAFAYAMNQYLANRGYVVLAVNFRAGIGYGKDFRRAQNQGPRGASEYQDIVAAAHYLQSLDYVDASKIGLWGGSYGGLLTAQGLARNSDIFKAGVDFHGVHDWAWRAEDFSKGGFWGITEELMQEAYQSSPVAEVHNWKSPVLFIHGDDDRNVMFDQTVDLVQRLRDRNIYHEVLVFPDEVHGFYRWESWVRAYKATANFFDRFLK